MSDKHEKAVDLTEKALDEAEAKKLAAEAKKLDPAAVDEVVHELEEAENTSVEPSK